LLSTKRPQFPCQDGVPRTYLLLIEMLEIQQGHKTKTPLVKMQDKYLLKLTHVWYQYHSQQVRIMIIHRDQNQ
jgi:hypothetical protein